MNDQSHCNTQYYLYGDSDATNEYNKGCGIPILYLKINGEITAFSYKSKQYSLRLTGEAEPVFDLYFDKLPNEQDFNYLNIFGCTLCSKQKMIYQMNWGNTRQQMATLVHIIFNQSNCFIYQKNWQKRLFKPCIGFK